jgi:hypothetical protein
MCIGSVPDPTQPLLLMLVAARHEPALIRRPKQRSWKQGFEEFLSDAAAEQAGARSLSEEKVAEILVE